MGSLGPIISPTDPGAVGSGRFWLTPDGHLYLRNANNTGWLNVCTDCTPANPVVQTGCGNSLGVFVDLVFDDPMTAGHLGVAWLTTTGQNIPVPPAGWAQIGPTVQLYDPLNLAQCASSMWWKFLDGAENGHTTVTWQGFQGSGRPKIVGWELDHLLAPTTTAFADQQFNGAGLSRSNTLSPLAIAGPGLVIVGFGGGADDPLPCSISPFTNIYVQSDGFPASNIAASYDAVAGSVSFVANYHQVSGFERGCGVAAFFPHA